jgi:hypothetical protein
VASENLRSLRTPRHRLFLGLKLGPLPAVYAHGIPATTNLEDAASVSGVVRIAAQDNVLILARAVVLCSEEHALSCARRGAHRVRLQRVAELGTQPVEERGKIRMTTMPGGLSRVPQQPLIDPLLYHLVINRRTPSKARHH